MTKDILAIVDNADRAALFLDAAVACATARGAHLEIVALTSGPYLASEILPLGVAYVPDAALAAQGRELVTAVEALVAQAGCRVSVFGLYDDIAWLAGDVRRSRQVTDLILLGSDSDWAAPWLRRRVLETSILSSGTPTLTLPPGGSLPPVGHAVLGWKPGPEANRAVHDLVALAEPGARIDVVMIEDDGTDQAAASGDEVRRHLLRHGFQVEVHRLPTNEMSEGDALQGFAVRSRAELLAVGGFGHSRLREILLGGVTRYLVEDAALPVMFSH